MGILGSLFGGSSQSSQQRQVSDSFGASMNRGSSRSSSGGSSSAVSGGSSASRDSIFSGDLLRQLYGGALGAADAINPAVATERTAQLFTGGSSILDRLAEGGAGTDYLERRLSGEGSDVLDAQIGAIGKDLGRFFTDELNPAITGSAVAAGQLGGGRQGVAQGEAMSSVLEQFATQAGNLRAADIANRDSAALGLLDRQNAAGATALGALPQLAALGRSNPSLDVYSQLSDIFGAPTVTNEATSQQFSEEQASEYAQSIAEELGISVDQAHSLLTATSKGKSSGGIIPGLGKIFSFGGG